MEENKKNRSKPVRLGHPGGLKINIIKFLIYLAVGFLCAFIYNKMKN